jgi:pyruvate dehydrogenase E2 component (dihydrolipoamide acetyltransferase)
VSEGDPLLELDARADTSASRAAAAPPILDQQEPERVKPSAPAAEAQTALRPAGGLPAPIVADFGGVHASPSVRRLARELEIDLTKIKGTGAKGRITKDDVKASLRGPGTAPAAGMGIPEIPTQDFSKFGPIESQPLSRIKKQSGPHLHRAWLNIPHVTHTDEADITDLEAYRKTLDAAAKEKGYRVTMLAFLMKASVVALKEYPEVNSSLSPAKDSLIIKKYFHLGVAVDTPDGLVVPVIKEVDRKGILELSQELGAVSKRMREGKIAAADIQGGTFSISSLGGIGGTHFTPIVNAPEVAILGVARSRMAPVWDGKAFAPRLMLPLSLSYDHRVIDGALAARFTRRLAQVLEDVRQLVL